MARDVLLCLRIGKICVALLILDKMIFRHFGFQDFCGSTCHPRLDMGSITHVGSCKPFLGGTPEGVGECSELQIGLMLDVD